jgi:hypothetical protein
MEMPVKKLCIERQLIKMLLIEIDKIKIKEKR